RQDRAQREIDSIVARHDESPEANKRLGDLKEALAILSGLEAQTPKAFDRYLSTIDRTLDGKQPLDRNKFKAATGPVTGEQLYVNQKVSDLVSNAEMEQSDYRRGMKPNVFFGVSKRYFGIKVNVLAFNTAVLVGSTIGLLGLLHWILRRQLKVRRS